MNQSIDDLPNEILIEIIGNLSSYIADYLPLKLVSSNWKDAINCYFKSIKYLVHRYIWNNSKEMVTKYGLIVFIPDTRSDLVISYMELFPNLEAVSVELSEFTKKNQNTLFNYLNTRPTITSLELVCSYDTKLQNNVKLENIRNFALNADDILSRKAIKRLFQADHKFTQLWVKTIVSSKLSFEDEITFLKTMPTLKRLTQYLELIWSKCYRVNGRFVDDTDLLIYNFTKQPGLSFENLESYSFYAHKMCLLFYVDSFVSCCPNLKSVDCLLGGGSAGSSIFRLNSLRVHTNVENLVIRGCYSSWEFVLKVLEMFPMIKNLKLQDMRGIGHNQISQALLKLPNLSLLYLRRLYDLSPYYHKHQATARVNCEALREEYKSKYGRNLQIVRRDGRFEFEKIPFRHGFNFMKNIFWPDWPPRLIAD